MSRLSEELDPTIQMARGNGRFAPLDILVVTYTAWVALLVAWFHGNIQKPIPILVFHAIVLGAILALPARGAPWETAPAGESALRRNVRGGLRFLRYTYPLLLVLFFFEEVQQTVGAVYPDSPYWFEPTLYAWDRWVFGELPAILLDPFVGFWQDEILHGFYFSYYFILVGGVVSMYFGGRERPSAAFQPTLSTAITAFILCFGWYPFLPARGPWENPELMASLKPFQGLVFTPIIQKIIEHGAVSGGCFPSSHVAASWGVVFGVARFRRKTAGILALFALGMSFACVYTRYHHAVDVAAGLIAALMAALIVRVAAS